MLVRESRTSGMIGTGGRNEARYCRGGNGARDGSGGTRQLRRRAASPLWSVEEPPWKTRGAGRSNVAFLLQ